MRPLETALLPITTPFSNQDASNGLTPTAQIEKIFLPFLDLRRADPDIDDSGLAQVPTFLRQPHLLWLHLDYLVRGAESCLTLSLTQSRKAIGTMNRKSKNGNASTRPSRCQARRKN